MSGRVIRYAPPKSNRWGHLMTRRTPSGFCRGVEDFLEQSSRSHRTTDRWVSMYVDASRREQRMLAQEFVLAAGLPDSIMSGRDLTDLDDEAFDRALRWLMENHQRLPRVRHARLTLHVSLARWREIRGWKVGEQALQADPSKFGGLLTECYGTLQRLGTELTFSSMEQYASVKAIAHSTLGIRMDERNLRGVVRAPRRPRRQPSAGSRRLRLLEPPSQAPGQTPGETCDEADEV